MVLTMVVLAVVLAAVLAGAIGALPARAHSQRTQAAGVGDRAARSVAGHVFVARGSGRSVAAGTWVTLHRIGPDSAAPIDSMKTGASGAFSFRYRPTGDTTAVYLVAAQYAGIAYYSAPLRSASVTGVDADLIVYDTASVGAPVKIASHHVIVSAPDATRRRTVIEVFVVTNAGDRTRVATTTSPTFSARLPAGAANAQVSDGEVAPDAMTFVGGRVRVTAPISPGTKRLSYTYTLSAREPIALSSSDTAAVLEILVEDPAAKVEGNVVREEAPTTVSGRTFKRYSGQNVANTDALRIVAPSGLASVLGAPGIVALVMATAMGIILVITLRTGRPVMSKPVGSSAGSSALAPPGSAA